MGPRATLEPPPGSAGAHGAGRLVCVLCQPSQVQALPLVFLYFSPSPSLQALPGCYAALSVPLHLLESKPEASTHKPTGPRPGPCTAVGALREGPQQGPAPGEIPPLLGPPRKGPKSGPQNKGLPEVGAPMQALLLPAPPLPLSSLRERQFPAPPAPGPLSLMQHPSSHRARRVPSLHPHGVCHANELCKQTPRRLHRKHCGRRG